MLSNIAIAAPKTNTPFTARCRCTVHAVKGRGNYSNTYSKDHLVDHVQIVIYTGDKHARRIATLIMQTADVGAESEGLVEITSVDELFWVHEQSLAVASEFKYFEVSRGE